MMDPYAPCPCGSGKKVKFCCQAILPEMSKIERLQENNQPRMALQLIDKLLKEHPDNGWLVTQRAMALFNDDRFDEARDSLVPFLRGNQDHPLANGLLAVAVSQLEPVENCKKVFHRAFLKSMSGEPQLCAILAGKLAAHHFEQGHEMAARQHMAMVVRLGSDQERQQTLMAMLELDSDEGIPYPLRGGHPLPRYEPPEELQAEFKKAQRLYVHGCFSEAADLFEKLTERDAENSQLWHTLGLMRAWDGDEARAAQALHRAAELYDEFDTAVELETIAQLLEQRGKENAVPMRLKSYDLGSPSRLLTRMDNEDRFARQPMPDDGRRAGASASFDILDRPMPTDAELAEMTIETTPRSIGRIVFFDQTPDGRPASAHITAIEGERFDQARELFESTAGDLAVESSRKGEQEAETDEPDEDIVGWYSRNELNLIEAAYFPAKTPADARRRLREELIRKCVDENWMNAPQPELQGKSPAEAAGEETLRVRLAAAIHVLDAFLDRRGLILDRDPLRERLGIPAPQAIQAADDLDLSTLSICRLQRLDLRQMSDALFNRTMQRAMVLKHSGHQYQVLREFLTNRPELREENPQETQRAYGTLAEICQHSLREEEALDWIKQGFEFAQSHNAPFENLLMWKMQELTCRARNVEDPAFKELLLELWNYYGAKVPQVREQLQQFVQALKIDPPWESAIVVPQGGESGTDWSGEGSPSGEKKLWLPD
jgi:tetratricopeptide (TPR) repeat protein